MTWLQSAAAALLLAVPAAVAAAQAEDRARQLSTNNHFRDLQSWWKHLTDDMAQRIETPIVVTVEPAR